jgi:hypothetical protein
MTKSSYVTIYSLPTDWGYRSLMFDKGKQWEVQRPPYRDPLPFICSVRRVLADTEFPSNGVSMAPGYDDSLTVLAYNKAYDKLKDRIGDNAAWAVNLAEWKQSVSTIEKRGLQLLAFTRKLKRFDFFGAANELGLGRPPRGVSRRKQFSNNFLEFHFGWEPAIKDIGSSIKILESDFGSKAVKGRATSETLYPYTTGSGSGFYSQLVKFTSHVTIGADVRISNPNLNLASQMGFINPLTVAWELVPFSFVVDWFVNVGAVLGACTDFAGMSLERKYVTRFQETSNQEVWGYGRHQHSVGYYTRRSVGSIPGPTLAVRPFKGFSAVRGATAIALLVQQLKH